MTKAILAAVLVCCTGGLIASSQADTDVTAIEPQALAARIDRGAAPLIVDVRTPAEYAKGHIPGAINIPHDALPGRIDELGTEQDEEIVVYCGSGRRAGLAESVLIDAGFSHVRDLKGHWRDWPGTMQAP